MWQHKEEMHVKAKKHSSTRGLWGLVWRGEQETHYEIPEFENSSEQDKDGQRMSVCVPRR